MKYYRLLDDVHIKDRWHLGEVTSRVDGSTLDLRLGVRMDSQIILESQITHAGQALDFCLTSFATPVARKGLAHALAAVSHDDLQLLPVNIGTDKSFEIINVVRVISCLDEKRSEFVKWSKADHRSDLAGQYRMVTDLKVDPAQIPRNVNICRITGWLIAIVVSDTAKAAMENAGCVGAKFQEVD